MSYKHHYSVKSWRYNVEEKRASIGNAFRSNIDSVLEKLPDIKGAINLVRELIEYKGVPEAVTVGKAFDCLNSGRKLKGKAQEIRSYIKGINLFVDEWIKLGKPGFNKKILEWKKGDDYQRIYYKMLYDLSGDYRKGKPKKKKKIPHPRVIRYGQRVEKFTCSECGNIMHYDERDKAICDKCKLEVDWEEHRRDKRKYGVK